MGCRKVEGMLFFEVLVLMVLDFRIIFIYRGFILGFYFKIKVFVWENIVE